MLPLVKFGRDYCTRKAQGPGKSLTTYGRIGKRDPNTVYGIRIDVKDFKKLSYISTKFYIYWTTHEQLETGIGKSLVWDIKYLAVRQKTWLFASLVELREFFWK